LLADTINNIGNATQAIPLSIAFVLARRAVPIVGILIAFAILGIVWQSARAVLTWMLDGVDPGIIQQIRHAAEHVVGLVQQVERHSELSDRDSRKSDQFAARRDEQYQRDVIRFRATVPNPTVQRPHSR
jgi:hypothetical protein